MGSRPLPIWEVFGVRRPGRTRDIWRSPPRPTPFKFGSRRPGRARGKNSDFAALAKINRWKNWSSPPRPFPGMVFLRLIPREHRSRRPGRDLWKKKQASLEFAALVKFAGKIGARRPGGFLSRFAHVATADLGRLDLGPLPWSGRDHAIYWLWPHFFSHLPAHLTQ